MKKRNLVWIPVLGIYLAKYRPFIALNNNWFKYQLTSIILFGIFLLYAIYNIASLLMLIY